MHKMTARSAKWMATVKANFAKATGKPVEAWVKRARAKGMDGDVAATRRWLGVRGQALGEQRNVGAPIRTELSPSPVNLTSQAQPHTSKRRHPSHCA